MSLEQYLPTIGLECHVQLKTKTKLFSGVGNDASEAPPNSLISHIDVGLPGALPVLNQAAVELASRAAFALGSAPQPFSQFDRKHYFYPDLPKGYQISQYDQPLIKGGEVEIWVDGVAKKVGIIRAHLEEDAGKNSHPAAADYSLVDLNRAGTPLLEIVTAPDLHSAAEAKTFARELYLLMRYAEVSDVDLYLGHLRFDVNVSVSADPKTPGLRTELKNLNSFRSVEAAIDYEIKRQIEILEKGQPVVQETRGWDEVKQKTTPQRSKEEAEDYRYMPEPDIPPLGLDQKFIDGVKAKMPMLPAAIRQQLVKLNVDAKVIEDILDRPEIVPRVLEAPAEHARRVAFDLLEDAGHLKVSAADHQAVAEMVAAGELSSSAARAVLKELQKTPGARAAATKLNLLQVSDEDSLLKIVEQVIADNPAAAADVQAGQAKAIGFLVGQVMAKSKGQANPQTAQKLLQQRLSVG